MNIIFWILMIAIFVYEIVGTRTDRSYSAFYKRILYWIALFILGYVQFGLKV